jgi:hypothetical protein
MEASAIFESEREDLRSPVVVKVFDEEAVVVRIIREELG